MIPCLNGATIGKASFEEFLDAAAAAGFPAVDVGIEPLAKATEETSIEAAGNILAGRGLKAASFFASPEWRKEDADLERTMAGFPRMAEIAAQLGISKCLTWIPPTAAVPFQERFRQIAPRLREIYDVLDRYGIRFGIEFIGPATLRKSGHEFIYKMEQGLELAQAIGPKAGLLLDSFHWYTSGATLEELRKVPAAKIIHVHINDAPDRPREEQIDGERLLPGDGIIDLKGFLECLREIGYTGEISVETFNADLRKLPPVEAAKRAKAALDGVLSK